jgi:hypothetical protein
MRRIAVAVVTGVLALGGASEASAACKRPQGAFWPTEPNWAFPITKGSGLVLPMRKLEVWSPGGRLNYPDKDGFLPSWWRRPLPRPL